MDSAAVGTCRERGDDKAALTADALSTLCPTTSEQEGRDRDSHHEGDILMCHCALVAA